MQWLATSATKLSEEATRERTPSKTLDSATPPVCLTSPSPARSGGPGGALWGLRRDTQARRNHATCDRHKGLRGKPENPACIAQLGVNWGGAARLHRIIPRRRIRIYGTHLCWKRRRGMRRRGPGSAASRDVKGSESCLRRGRWKDSRQRNIAQQFLPTILAQIFSCFRLY